jgi:hypothetical protein
MDLPDQTGSFAYWLVASPGSFMLGVSLGFYAMEKHVFCLITKWQFKYRNR